MNQLIFNIVFWGGFVGGGSIFIIFCIIMAIKQHKKDKKQQQSNTANKENEIYEPVFTTLNVKSTVIDQYCAAKMIGTKTPKAIKIFTVVFRTNDNEILKFDVPEEMYDGFEKGQSGILTVVDGTLYGFTLDESKDNI